MQKALKFKQQKLGSCSTSKQVTNKKKKNFFVNDNNQGLMLYSDQSS